MAEDRQGWVGEAQGQLILDQTQRVRKRAGRRLRLSSTPSSPLHCRISFLHERLPGSDISARPQRL